jgi:hypothetical protein
MKNALISLSLLLVFMSSAFAKIVMVDDKVFLRKDGKQVPIFLVNDYIEHGKVKKVHLYGDGNLHIISFAIKKQPEKLYSVDDQGFIYSIEPYSRYSVNKITDADKFEFRELPGKHFRVTDKGYFIH